MARTKQTARRNVTEPQRTAPPKKKRDSASSESSNQVLNKHVKWTPLTEALMTLLNFSQIKEDMGDDFEEMLN